MRMIVHITIPHDAFNARVKDGSAGSLMGKIMEKIKPEHIWFSEKDGQRGAVMIVDVGDMSQIPSIAEPWFLSFEADCEFRIAMTPEDLQKAGLEELGKEWS